jgi:hypothetical protein
MKVDLSVLGYDQIAGHFADRAVEIGDDFPRLMEPLLYAAKGVMALAKLNKQRVFRQGHMEKWRMNVSWLVYAKGALTEKVAKLDTKAKDLKSDLWDTAVKSLGHRGIKISDDKIQNVIRQNKEFRTLDGQLSDLRAILAHVVDHCDHYKLTKDVLVQESTLTKRIMSD